MALVFGSTAAPCGLRPTGMVPETVFVWLVRKIQSATTRNLS
jgi:hypothetical protein